MLDKACQPEFGSVAVSSSVPQQSLCVTGVHGLGRAGPGVCSCSVQMGSPSWLLALRLPALPARQRLSPISAAFFILLRYPSFTLIYLISYITEIKPFFLSDKLIKCIQYILEEIVDSLQSSV